jgi:LuxR family maltose regulon positive regulatory protein
MLPSRFREAGIMASDDGQHRPDPAFEISDLALEFRSARDSLMDLADSFRRRADTMEAGVALGADMPVSDHGSRLEIQCLGGFSVSLDGEPILDRTSGKSVGVLKYLATRPTLAATREQLMEALWGDSDIEAASNRLRVAVHGLRRLLPPHLSPNLMLYQDGLYRIDPSYEVVVDVRRFTELWERADRLEQAGFTEQAASLYREAELLYHGDFLEEDLYEDWANIPRESLRDAYLTLEFRLAWFALERADYAACIDRAAKIIERDSCNEEAYALLMRSHAARGNLARAVRWYEICEHALVAELDARPSPELRQLLETITTRGTPDWD